MKAPLPLPITLSGTGCVSMRHTSSRLHAMVNVLPPQLYIPTENQPVLKRSLEIM